MPTCPKSKNKCNRLHIRNNYCILCEDKSSWEQEFKDLSYSNFWNAIKIKVEQINTYNEEFYEGLRDDGPKNYIFKGIHFPSFFRGEKGDNTYVHRYEGDEPGDPGKRELNIFEGIKPDLEIIFENCTFHQDVDFTKIKFDNPISFQNCTFHKGIDFSGNTFKQPITISKNSRLDLLCKNTRFMEFVELSDLSIKESNFESTIFEKNVDFSRTGFLEDAEFKYTDFKQLAIFHGCQFEKRLDLSQTIFKGEAVFFDMEFQSINRETARKIKYAFENQNNIIEANRYYAHEMKEREKELKTFSRDWWVFKIHGISSDHSQDWVLALLWIFAITFFYFLSKDTIQYPDIERVTNIVFVSLALLMTIGAWYFFEQKYQKLILFVLVILMSFFVNWDKTITLLNPFAFSSKGCSVTMDFLLLKVALAYLYYQFIISIRQNTRRK